MPRRWLAALAAAALAALVASRTTDARADGQGQGQGKSQTEADALFTQGRELLERGQYAEACEKLARSDELAPAVGTQLNLGYCWEQMGKWRSAMDAYAEAEALATKANDAKRATFAKDRLAAAEPKATRVIVRVVPPEAPGIEVKRNGAVVARADWEKPVAVDPDAIEVTATAAGYAAWKGVVMASGQGAVVTVYVPPLEPLAKRGARAAAASASGSGLGARRVAAIVLGTTAIAALAAGGATALGAKQRYDDSLAGCDAGGCDASALDAQHGAVTQGNIATALIGLGVGFAVAGIYLWIVGAPAESAPRTAAVASAFAGGARFP